MQINQLDVGRQGLRLTGGSTEPAVSIEQLTAAIKPEDVESLRPLLPVGYSQVAGAYRRAVIGLSDQELSNHYTEGLDYFHVELTPKVKEVLETLSGGQWRLSDYVAFAAGSDVDMMTHIVRAAAAEQGVSLFPGDWYGFRVGCTDQTNIVWSESSENRLACLCIPSVRNGHVTPDMLRFLEGADACLLNINLFPTLPAEERQAVAQALLPVLPKSILSCSFSRGFGMTASQLGVMLIHKDHPYVDKYRESWTWFSYFYNYVAARAFGLVDLSALQLVDEARREWVHKWLADHGLPVTTTGTYYVKAFRASEAAPDYLRPLARDDVVRLCFKPPLT